MAKKKPDMGKVQDFLVEAKLHMNRAHEAFKDGLLNYVRAGRLITAHPDAPHDLPEERAAVFVQLAKDFPNPEAFSDAQWQAADEQYMQAIDDWIEVSKSDKANKKRQRAQQRLRNNPLAEMARLSLKDYR